MPAKSFRNWPSWSGAPAAADPIWRRLAEKTHRAYKTPSTRFTPYSTDCYNCCCARCLRRRSLLLRRMCVSRLQLATSRSCSKVKRSAFPETRCQVVRRRPEQVVAKSRTMNKNCIPVAVLAAGALFALSTPLRAQIAIQVDEHGKLVFVNGDSPNARRGSTISSATGSSTSGGSHSRSGISTGSAAEALGANDGRLDRIVRDAAARHQVDPALVKAVISTESGWNP